MLNSMDAAVFYGESHATNTLSKNKVVIMNLAIITPSYIHSRKRFLLAKNSFESLQSVFGSKYPHIIIDDNPQKKGIMSFFSSHSKWYGSAKKIYTGEHITLIKRKHEIGSASATLAAVREARKQGAELIFIHLDDQVYSPHIKNLIEYSCDAFDRENDLLLLRFSGLPILCNQCSKSSGNRTLLHISRDNVSFENITFTPSRYEEYTLWSSYFNEDTLSKNYWLALWMAVYRIDFLEELLTYGSVPELKHLSHVEIFYKNKDNWHSFLRTRQGKFGYINMQFGGYEMDKSKNWEEILRFPNTAIR